MSNRLDRAEKTTVFVTGGAGFIGSNFLNLFVPLHPNVDFVNVDALTYAGNLLSLKEIQNQPNYRFRQVDISSEEAVNGLFEEITPDGVIHFAAETHVDRSIRYPREFVAANILGTFNLLEACRQSWTHFGDQIFHHVSTDEVYGSLGETGSFKETTPYDPSSPYSASKASSDHLVRSFNHTYGMPVTITNCSNNYGPFQFPEKLLPVMILNASEGKRLPVYGKGENVRDWLYVKDHCEAIWAVANRGRAGETYNVGGSNEVRNIDLVHTVCDQIARRQERPEAELRSLVEFVADRPGHDFRYAIDDSKIRAELGWSPHETFETGIARTIAWYLENPEWINQVRSGEYRKWMATNYTSR